LSGIEIFKQNPELFVDDDEAAGAEELQTEYKGLETILTVTGTSIVAVKKQEDKEKEKVVIDESKDDEVEDENKISEQDINTFGIQLGATEEDLNTAITPATFDESLFTEEIPITTEDIEQEGEIEDIEQQEGDDENNIDQDIEGTPKYTEVSEKYGENGTYPED